MKTEEISFNITRHAIIRLMFRITAKLSDCNLPNSSTYDVNISLG